MGYKIVNALARFGLTAAFMLLAIILLLAVPFGHLAAQSESLPAADADAEPERPTRGRLRFIAGPYPLDAVLDDRLPLEWVESTPVELDEELLNQRLDEIEELSLSVSELEREGGAWEDGLVELLSELGDLQAAAGDFAAAVQTLDRAVHINRINSGLHTLEQIPYIEKMIDSHIAAGEWAQADLYSDYLFYIQQKAYGSRDPRMIPVLDRLANWHLHAFQVGYGESMGLRLSTAQIMLNAAARLVMMNYGPADDRYPRYMNQIAASAFLVTQNPELISDVTRSDFQMGQDALISRLQQPNNGIIMGRRAGFEALKRIVDRQRDIDAPAADLAEAITHLADWSLIFDRRREAEELYKEAWDLLHAEEGNEAKIAELFGQVVRIPAFGDGPVSLFGIDSSDVALTDLQSGVADISFNLTAFGDARNVRVIGGETEDNASMLSRLRRYIRESYFRPRFVDGMPVDSEDNQFRFQYWF